jgi:GntR family transcriptional regulator, transcriptional repressor for pyruvate dehydrogenase complex
MTDGTGQDDAAPLSVGRRTERVYQALLSGIQEGRFKSNSKLPTENELADTFSVSRPVVRNALALLRRDGLVKSVQGSGTVVLSNANGGGTPEQTFPEMAGGSVRDLQRCFEFRLIIEGEAAHAAALRHNPHSLDRLSDSIYAARGAAQPRPYQAFQTFDFHRAVIDAADNVFLQQSLDLIVNSAGFRVYLSRSGRGTDAVSQIGYVNAEHIEIFRLIERRQANDAREAMKGHIQRAYEHFMERIPLTRAD